MLGVSRKTLSEFVNEKASLSPEMVLWISKWRMQLRAAARHEKARGRYYPRACNLLTAY